eukprot:jgi/Bigna1/146823/aug1.121_g21531
MDWDQFSHCFLNSNMYMNFYNLCSTRLYTEYMASGLEKLEKEEKILKKRYRQLQCFMEVSQYNAWVCKEVVKQLKRNSFHSEGILILVLSTAAAASAGAAADSDDIDDGGDS